ncbi:MAG: hypothetical protein DHS20C15_34630 [Planctomycetota bacterium]|nr:MAG: hypothetical protein DHS20C15_34630 [Planctomycetota bacterium]
MITHVTKSLSAALLVATCLLSSPGAAEAQILVPGDFGDLQDAINTASPGDVIVIDGGTHGPIVIDKALTLTGKTGTPPKLTTHVLPMPPNQSPCVELAGPGSGRVTIKNCLIEGTTNGGSFSMNAPAIAGGGFDELHVVNCYVEAPRWLDVTGGAVEQPGIEVDIPFTLIATSTVIGGFPDDNVITSFPFPFPEGGSGIVSTGDVAVFDSTVRGGEGFHTTWDVDAQGAVPALCSEDYGLLGVGGLAIEVQGDLLFARSALEAGEGGTFHATKEDFGTWFVCQQNRSPTLDVSGEIHDLNSSGFLMANGPLIPNQDFQLLWDAEAPGSILVLGLQPQAPLAVGEKGLLFANPSSLQFFPAPGLGVQLLSLSVPVTPNAEGITAVVQRYTATEGLSAPVFAGYVPN